MYRIFISYRRSDSESFAGRLRDRLRADFGKRSVFMDTSTITAGAKFDEAIAQNLKSCKVFIAVIGNTWLSCKNEAGVRRLDDPADWVRIEVAQALASAVLVIPVTFGGAKMPGVESLPAELHDLARRNAASINDADFDSDVQRLIAACEPLVPRPRRWPWIAGAAALLVALAGGWFYNKFTKMDFRGAYIVADRPYYGRLPITRDGTSGTQYYLALSTGGKHFSIPGLTRKGVLIVSDAGLDAPNLPQDIELLKAEVGRHFQQNGADDFEAIAIRVSSEPDVVTSLRVQPGAQVIAEIGIFEPGSDGQSRRKAKARCEFSIPTKPAVASPVFFVTAESPECKPAR